MLRMDEFNKIRKEFHLRGKSIYQISKEYNRSWQTIKNIVSMPEHKVQNRGHRPNRKPKVITPEIEKRINEFLDFEIFHKVPKKQRFTASYIFKKLVDEKIYNGSSKSIRSVVAKLRKQRKLLKKETFLNLEFEFGKFIQIDHGIVELIISNKRISGYLFVASVPGFALRYCQFYPTKASEAWGEFHEKVFSFFGGVFPNIIYDNDSVLKVNSIGEQTTFCQEMQIHYRYKAIFCNKASGWEKGSVENAVGFCRRNFLAGLSSFDNLSTVNNYLDQKCLETIIEGKLYTDNTPTTKFYDQLKEKLQFHNSGKTWGKWKELAVNQFQQISYQNYKYSVPEKYVGSILKVFISIFKIDIYDGTNLVYSHDRRYSETQDSLVLDHYLDQLLKKPKSIQFASVLKNTKLPSYVLEIKRRYENKFSEKEAGIQFIKTMLLRRKSSKEDFEIAIKMSLSYNAINFEAVKSILQQLQTDQVRIMPLPDFPNIDNHFNLNKYAELEKGIENDRGSVVTA